MNQSDESPGCGLLHQSTPLFSGSSKLISNTCANCRSTDPGGTWRRDPLTDENLCNSCGLKIQRKRKKESLHLQIPSTKTAKVQPSASPAQASPVGRQILQLYLLLGTVVAAQDKAEVSAKPSSSSSEPKEDSNLPDPFSQPNYVPTRPPDQMIQEGELGIPVKKGSLVLSSSASYGSLLDLLLSKSIHLDQ